MLWSLHSIISYLFNSFSQFLYATPVPKPPPRIIGQALRRKNNTETTVPITNPPPGNLRKMKKILASFFCRNQRLHFVPSIYLGFA